MRQRTLKMDANNFIISGRQENLLNAVKKGKSNSFSFFQWAPF